MNIHLSLLFKTITVEDSFFVAKEAGFDGVDFCPGIKHLFINPKRIKELAQIYKIDITGIHCPLYFIPYAPGIFFNKMLQLAKDFPKAKTFCMHLSSFITPFHKDYGNIIKFNKLALDMWLDVIYESNPIFAFLNKYPKQTWEAAGFAKYCKNNQLKMVLDTSHIASVGGDIVDFYENNHKYISAIHLSDFKNGIEHLPLGKGDLALKSLLSLVQKKHQDPKIILEINELGNGTKDEKYSLLKDSYIFAKTYLT